MTDAEIERLRRSIEHRMHATVYERTAWKHDIGEHADSTLPYAFCPRCEIEHPQGAYHRLLDAAARLAELVEAHSFGDLVNGEYDRRDASRAALDAFRAVVQLGPHDPRMVSEKGGR